MNKTLVVRNKKEKGPALSQPQQTFNRLRKRVESLQKECLECTKTLERHLDLYAQKLAPKQKQIGEVLRQEIKLFYLYLKNKRLLTKEERPILRELISSLFQKIWNIECSDIKFDEELSQIYENIEGTSLKDMESTEFEQFKAETEAFFAEQGVHVNLDDIKMQGSKEETLEKIFEYVKEQSSYFQDKQEKTPPPKSKKEQEQEQRAQEKALLQKKEIGVVYKQLAKAFHPDLERDPIRKLEKEALMKKLTAAYEEGDMLTLLALEMNELKDSDQKIRSEDQLKIYNQLLQEQVESFQEQLRQIPLNYRYSHLVKYVHYNWKKGDGCLYQIGEGMDKEIRARKKMMKHIEKYDVAAVREILMEHQLVSLFGSDDDDF